MNEVAVTQQLPTALTQRQIQAQLNAKLANAYAAGDPRYQMKQLDRPGFSRGGAQMNQAGINAAQDIAAGVADAYSQNMQNQTYNADLLLRSKQSQESNAQALGALQQQQAYANQMAQLQRQQMAMNFASSLLGGLLK